MISCKVNPMVLHSYVKLYDHSWTCRERTIAKMALDNISRGTKTTLLHPLPGITCNNAASAFRNGEFLTDAIAYWIESGFVAGPFTQPPVPDFRSNQLMVKEEKAKVRPILNLSSPKHYSFNDAIDKNSLQKFFPFSDYLFNTLVHSSPRLPLYSKERWV